MMNFSAMLRPAVLAALLTAAGLASAQDAGMTFFLTSQGPDELFYCFAAD